MKTRALLVFLLVGGFAYLADKAVGVAHAQALPPVGTSSSSSSSSVPASLAVDGLDAGTINVNTGNIAFVDAGQVLAQFVDAGIIQSVVENTAFIDAGIVKVSGTLTVGGAAAVAGTATAANLTMTAHTLTCSENSQVNFVSNKTNGSTAIGYQFQTGFGLTTDGAKIIDVQTGGSSKWNIRGDGAEQFTGVANASLPACDAAHAGSINYDTTNSKHVGCNGSAWTNLY